MGENGGWTRTARTVLPRLIRLSGKIDPTFELGSVAEIDDDFLARHGVTGLIWDVDGTLMAHHAKQVDASVRSRFEALLARTDLRHAIVSNCQPPRFRELGEIFPSVPVLLGFKTPEGMAFRVMHRGRQATTGRGQKALARQPEIAPVRKPSAALIRQAIREMGMEEAPERVLVVGDQYFTDIASANLAGVRSAKVRTIDPGSFPMAVQLGQALEGALMRVRRVTSRRRRRE